MWRPELGIAEQLLPATVGGRHCSCPNRWVSSVGIPAIVGGLRIVCGGHVHQLGKGVQELARRHLQQQLRVITTQNLLTVRTMSGATQIGCPPQLSTLRSRRSARLP